MALSPERHTLLTTAAGVVMGMPAAVAAWRAGHLAGPGQQDLAHDHVVDLLGPGAGPLEGGPDGEGAELGGREGRRGRPTACRSGCGRRRR